MKNKIKEFLEYRHMSQKELSDKTGLTEVSISRYVAGSRIPNVSIAMRIAAALNTSIESIWQEK